MIKEDIVRKIIFSKEINLEKEEVREVVEMILMIAKQGLKDDQVLKISRFGQFRVNKKTDRLGRNPKTKVGFKISARKVVTFGISKIFREEISKNKHQI